MSTREMAYDIIDHMTDEQLKSFIILFSRYKDDTSKRIGIARGEIALPTDFDEQFDEMDDKISEIFGEGV